jgi:hypothetical protein
MAVAGRTRREMLRLCAAAGAWCVSRDVMIGAQNLPSPREALDHLLLGVADLDTGIDWVEQRTGVRAAIGGSHPGMGTRNALLSLGGRHYLEIIAPDPAQTAYNFRTDVRRLAEPRLVAWAALAPDISAIARRARDAGQQVFGPRDGSRARPDGTVIRWQTLGVNTDLSQDGVDPIPFFIQWGTGAPHPSQGAPAGCELQAFDLEHPDSSAVTAVLKAVGIEAHVAPGRAASLRVTLATRNGEIELS